MTESSAPVGFTWDGEAMRPASRFRQQCDRQFVIGQQYVLEERMERSSLSHRHYFASINELWHSLPEHLSAEYPSPEHLRKRALIRCGYRDQRSIVCASNAEALRVAAFIQPVDSYAEISVSGAVVVHLTAVSQNLKSMDRKTFGESKTAVLEWICELVGADPTLVQDAASMGRAA